MLWQLNLGWFGLFIHLDIWDFRWALSLHLDAWNPTLSAAFHFKFVISLDVLRVLLPALVVGLFLTNETVYEGDKQNAWSDVQ